MPIAMILIPTVNSPLVSNFAVPLTLFVVTLVRITVASLADLLAVARSEIGVAVTTGGYLNAISKRYSKSTY